MESSKPVAGGIIGAILTAPVIGYSVGEGWPSFVTIGLVAVEGLSLVAAAVGALKSDYSEINNR